MPYKDEYPMSYEVNVGEVYKALSEERRIEILSFIDGGLQTPEIIAESEASERTIFRDLNKLEEVGLIDHVCTSEYKTTPLGKKFLKQIEGLEKILK